MVFEALSFCRASAVFLSKTVPFLFGLSALRHFRGQVQFKLAGQEVSHSNITTKITHYGATRTGINGMHSDVVSEDRLLTISRCVRSKALPFCCASTVFLSKAAPFLAVPLPQPAPTR
eukprot:SAG22_NODE_1913_length_3322_cov_2.699969_6_plen_118_part_00